MGARTSTPNISLTIEHRIRRVIRAVITVASEKSPRKCSGRLARVMGTAVSRAAVARPWESRCIPPAQAASCKPPRASYLAAHAAARQDLVRRPCTQMTEHTCCSRRGFFKSASTLIQNFADSPLP